MADPFSIATGALGVVDICTRLARSIHQLRKDIKNIDKEVADLAEDVQRLTDICNAVTETYESRQETTPPYDDSKSAQDTRKLWKQVGKTLAKCFEDLKDLNALVLSIQGPLEGTKPNMTEALKKVRRRNSKETEIRDCRTRLAAHQTLLQSLHSAITCHDLGAVQNQNTNSFNSLSTDLQKLEENITSQISDLQKSMATSDSHQEAATVASLGEVYESIQLVKSMIEMASKRPTVTNHHFDIPQSVTSFYTGREALLAELRDIFLEPSKGGVQLQRRFVIHGLAGSGKTQFCCKFAQDNMDSFWGVFWMDASTPESIKNTLGTIAETAGLDRNADKNETAALTWLSNLGPDRNWLLIIDNADDDNIPLEKYFPKGNRGHVLVTTRIPAYKVHGNVGRRYYEFRGLGLDEAKQLLLKASEAPSPWDKSCEKLAQTITQALGYLALAIIHAGSAIRQGYCSLKDYLGYYDRTWQRIRYAKAMMISDFDSDKAIFTTWEICYNRLEGKHTEAAHDAMELLNVLAFLHRDKISCEIFTRALRNPGIESKQAQEAKHALSQKLSPTTYVDRLRGVPTAILTWLLQDRGPLILPSLIRDAQRRGDLGVTEDRIRSALAELTHMSLIARNEKSDTYSMHPVVHTWARERPRMRLSDQALWADVTGRLLAASILLPPLGNSSEDEKYHISLFPHIKHVQARRESTAKLIAAARHSGNLKSSWISWLVPALVPDRAKTRMYAKFSLVYAKTGQWEDARKLMEYVQGVLHRYSGPESELSRQASLFLATIYWQLSRPADAARIQSSVLEICTSHLGPSHLETLRVMGELGRTRWQQGHYAAARNLQETVLRELLKHLPRDHEDSLQAMDSLGLTVHKFWRRQHFEEAFKLHSEAAAGMARVHGEDHERTLCARENRCRVAVLLGGKHLESTLKDMMEVLETRRKKFGEKHPYTLLAMANMAIVYSAHGQPEEGEALILEGLPVAVRDLGDDHIGTLFGRHTLGSILIQQGRYADAEKELLDVTERQKQMSSLRGDYHPDRLGALIELARCYFLLGKIDQAIETCDEAIHGFEVISVEPHPLAKGLQDARSLLAQIGEHASMSVHPEIRFPFILFKASNDP